MEDTGIRLLASLSQQKLMKKQNPQSVRRISSARLDFFSQKLTNECCAKTFNLREISVCPLQIFRTDSRFCFLGGGYSCSLQIKRIANA